MWFVMETLDVKENICRVIERDLSLERCRCYIAHMRALLYLEDDEAGGAVTSALSGGVQAHRSLALLLDSLDKELQHGVALFWAANENGQKSV